MSPALFIAVGRYALCFQKPVSPSCALQFIVPCAAQVASSHGPKGTQDLVNLVNLVNLVRPVGITDERATVLGRLGLQRTHTSLCATANQVFVAFDCGSHVSGTQCVEM